MDKNKLESLRDRYLEQEKELEFEFTDLKFDGESTTRVKEKLLQVETKIELLNDLISLFE